jgi:polysaccharide chain length determinant protein (PEP-CTERM system associated)
MLGQRETTFEDYVEILRRRWWIVVTCVVVGIVAAYCLSRVLPKRYTSQTLVLVEPPRVPTSYVEPVVTGSLNARLASMQEQILSRTRLQPIVEQFDLYRQDRGSVPVEELVERLRAAIKVRAIRPTPGTQSELPGFTVSVTLGRPRMAQQVCAQITSMFMEENLRLRQSQAEDTTQFLDSQLNEARQKLDEQDAKMAAFQRRYMGVLPEDQTTNMNLLMSATQQLEALTQTLSRAQQDKAFAQAMLAQQIEAWKASQTGQNPETLEKQLSALQERLLVLKARYTDDHPDVIKAKRNIAQVKKRIQESAARQKEGASTQAKGSDRSPLIEPPEMQQLRVQVHQDDVAIQEATRQQEKLQKQIQAIQARLQLTPSVQEAYKQLTRDHQTALDFYNSLLKKQKESAIATDLERRQQSEQFRVLDPANLPDKPSFPNPLRLYPGGLGGGLALGLGIVVLVEMRDKKLRTEQDVHYFLELPTLALIPWIEPGKIGSNDDGKMAPAGRQSRFKLTHT